LSAKSSHPNGMMIAATVSQKLLFLQNLLALSLFMP
jgi:hypothetical protein